jgi:hypothetical protein
MIIDKINTDVIKEALQREYCERFHVLDEDIQDADRKLAFIATISSALNNDIKVINEFILILNRLRDNGNLR